MTTALARREGGELLTVEKARNLLAQCRKVDEVRQIKDMAIAMQVYARKKKAGEESEADAGAIVTYACARLAQFHQEAKKASGGNQKKKQIDRSVDLNPSREKIAEEAGENSVQLRRWSSLAKATPEQLDRAIARAKQTKQGVTPTTVMRALTKTSSQEHYDGDEWYTPPNIIELVRKTLGGIDLDPASNDHAQKTVGAAKFYTKSDDALTKQWRGRVFCNPPYSMPLIEKFTAKLIEEFDASRTTAAIYLVNNCTDAAWCQSLLRRFPVCFTAGRIGFMNRNGQAFATRQGQALFYLGSQPELFASVFEELGTVLRR